MVSWRLWFGSFRILDKKFHGSGTKFKSISWKFVIYFKPFINTCPGEVQNTLYFSMVEIKV
jgi:hypothetical protein